MLSIHIVTIIASASVLVQGATVPLTKEAPAEIQARLENATTVGMIWTGPVFKGHPNVTLTGDAESIMNQIIDLNPDYAPEDSAVALGLVDKTTFLPVGDLHKRETYSCHGLEAAIASEIEKGVTYLANLGGYCGAPASSCARMTCSEDSGTFICAEYGLDVGWPCSTAALSIFNIMNVCRCSNNLVFGNAYYETASTWVALARCWKGGNERPTDNPYGSQPNHGPKNC